AYIEALPEQGLDVDAAVKSGMFVVVDGPGTTVQGAIDFWEQSCWSVMTGGPTVIRVVGEMGCERKLFGSDAEMMSYEVAFNMIAKRFPTVTLCQYDVREFD